MSALFGKTAVVTGGASGIGRAIASDLAAQGARVVIADLDDREGQALASSISGIFQRTDVSSRDDCRALIDRAVNEYSGADILVNNAGLQHVAPIEDFPEEKWEYIVRVMLVGAFYLTKYAIPYMYARGWGRVINVSSVHGLVASPYKSAYVAAKHGLNGLTKTSALEAAEKGVPVNASRMMSTASSQRVRLSARSWPRRSNS